MRLRYLDLPRYGPLTEIKVVFGREDLIARTLNLPRKGSLNFVVGVNGSGKSSLLRALYRIYRSLNRREWPEMPVTLAWDRSQGGITVTTLLHFTNRPDSVSFFATLSQVPTTARGSDWEEIISALARNQPHPLVEVLDRDDRSDAIANPALIARLPKRVIAYTSGSDDPWVQLDHRALHSREENDSYQPENERPPGWSMDQEWEEEQPIRIENVLTRYALNANGASQSIIGGELGELSLEVVDRLRQELDPLGEIRDKLFANRMVGNERLDDSHFRLRSRHLRLAGITLSLLQAANELAEQNEALQREALRIDLTRQTVPSDRPQGARRVLNEIDWFWPTHLSLTYRDTDDRVSPRQHEELLALVALADEVVAQPRGRQRAVFSLGPATAISLTERLREAFPFGVPNKAIDFIAERVDGSQTMAEAILRVFSEAENLDATPFDVFARLRDWERTGLLEDLTLTVKRLHRPDAADGEPDDTIVSYDQLSDGEQMLLGRMGLLFLLRGQDGSLLLLDEPETHFNDVWKREIVEMIDMALLNGTNANVIVATHTSIALTDAFASEVTVLDKTDGQTTARGVAGGLFGTDPGEVNMNLFHAESSIGRRSVEILDQLLKIEWTGHEHELEEILKVLGSSFHRAELRAILKKLRVTDNGTAPTYTS